MIASLWLVTSLLQALFMGADEFYFHRRRGLPTWERIGHPADTLALLACWVFALTQPFSPARLPVYGVLAVFSSLLITKDEWVHARACPAAEHWLHAVLFVLHPAGLIFLGILWAQNAVPVWAAGQTGVTLIFLGYQLVYWNAMAPSASAATGPESPASNRRVASAPVADSGTQAS